MNEAARIVQPISPTAANKAPSGPKRLKELVPVLGYRNYWYPAMQSKRLKRKPQHLRILGDDIVFFRDSQIGKPLALADRCPHRNASLALGTTYYPGTITCPYHGWTFDGEGNLRAVLSEGPRCPVVGKVKQRSYPVEEFRAFIWIWMGDQAPVPLKDDLPPELADLSTELFTEVQVWKANWRDVTENTDGYHAPILHVHSMPRTLYMDWVAWRKTTFVESADRPGIIMAEVESEDDAVFPGLGAWPKIPNWKRTAKRIFGAKVGRGREIALRDGSKGRITEDVHLPGWRRVRVRKATVFIEWAVPIDERTTRHFLWDVVLNEECKTAGAKLKRRIKLELFRYFIYPVYWRWAYNERYVGQDKVILEALYDGPERLQGNDNGIVAWRKLATQARGYPPPESPAPPHHVSATLPSELA